MEYYYVFALSCYTADVIIPELFINREIKMSQRDETEKEQEKGNEIKGGQRQRKVAKAKALLLGRISRR